MEHGAIINIKKFCLTSNFWSLGVSKTAEKSNINISEKFTNKESNKIKKNTKRQKDLKAERVNGLKNNRSSGI